MSVVKNLENELLPLFRKAEQQAMAAHPDYKFRVSSFSIGGETEYQGHKLALECLLPDAKDNEADCVAIIVGVRHITTEPELCEAGVAWGGGEHPAIDLEIIEHPRPYSQSALHEVASYLPRLTETFHAALRAWSVRGVHA